MVAVKKIVKMKTFVSDIIPKIQKYSVKLDDLTLLTNQHWVAIDEINKSKTVYIFRSSNELIISQNGKVQKAKWEYLGHNSLLIERIDNSYLFKHGFFDMNILALKVDGTDEYAFLIRENRFDEELNSIQKVIDFLKKVYLDTRELREGKAIKYFDTNYGKLEIELSNHNIYPVIGNRAYRYSKAVLNGKYKIGFMWYFHIKDGVITNVTSF